MNRSLMAALGGAALLSLIPLTSFAHHKDRGYEGSSTIQVDYRSYGYGGRYCEAPRYGHRKFRRAPHYGGHGYLNRHRSYDYDEGHHSSHSRYTDRDRLHLRLIYGYDYD